MALINVRRKKLARKLVPVFPDKFGKVKDRIKWVKRELIETYPGNVEIREELKPRPFVYKNKELDERMDDRMNEIRRELGKTEELAVSLERRLAQARRDRMQLLRAADSFLKEFEKHPYINTANARSAEKIMSYSVELVDRLFGAYEKTRRQEYLERAYDLLESVEPLTRVEELRKVVPKSYLEEMKKIKKGVIG